jgi:hypothetical protein
MKGEKTFQRWKISGLNIIKIELIRDDFYCKINLLKLMILRFCNITTAVQIIYISITLTRCSSYLNLTDLIVTLHLQLFNYE